MHGSIHRPAHATRIAVVLILGLAVPQITTIHAQTGGFGQAQSASVQRTGPERGPGPTLTPLSAVRAAAVTPPVRVSVASDGTQANGDSWGASMSTDSRFVVFQSEASNLVAGDTNGVRDVFVYERSTGLTTRESVGPGGVQANGASSNPSISATGRYVAFVSTATNLVAGVSGSQIYVRDRQLGVTIVSSVSTAGVPGAGSSLDPSISGDGRYVAFDSVATNLITSDTNGCQDVFTHDLTPGPTTRDSVTSSGVEAVCTTGSLHPALSGDGRYVAFESDATNLGVTGVAVSTFVRDRVTGTTSLESMGTDGVPFTGSSGSPSISADGRYLSFHRAIPAGGDAIYLRDRSTGQTSGLVLGALVSHFSADGRYVSYLDSSNNLIVYDRLVGTFTTVAVGDTGSDISAVASGMVSFSTKAALVVNDTNQAYDVFVAAVPQAATVGAPQNLSSSLFGSTLTITWARPTIGTPTSYVIEAGSTSGATNIANFSTGSTATTFSASVGGTGVFYIRVRATDAIGTSDSSNEIVVSVGGGVAPPGVPFGLTASVAGSNVTLNWSAPLSGGAVAAYTIEAGSASGLTNLANFSTGNAATTFSAAGVGAGTYFVRVRASNAAGVSAPSSPVVLIIR